MQCQFYIVFVLCISWKRTKFLFFKEFRLNVPGGQMCGSIGFCYDCYLQCISEMLWLNLTRNIIPPIKKTIFI